MDDDELEPALRDAARAYHQPPEPPREAMWQAIQAERRVERARRPAVRRWTPWAVAAAAILALGVGIGRWSSPVTRVATVTPAPTTAAPRVNETAYRLATLEHLGQSETFLTLFRTSLPQGHQERLASATARQLLATNRLLLDSPAASDARTRLLLQDLELVLAEIAQLSLRPRLRDLDLITEGLEQGGVLSRLRTAVPSGASTTQGAL
jgi:hypothetical protein